MNRTKLQQKKKIIKLNDNDKLQIDILTNINMNNNNKSLNESNLIINKLKNKIINLKQENNDLKHENLKYKNKYLQLKENYNELIKKHENKQNGYNHQRHHSYQTSKGNNNKKIYK